MSRIPIRSPLSDSPRKPLVSFNDVLLSTPVLIYLMILPTAFAAFAVLIKSAPSREPSGNRQIILDVPRTSQVDAQVTSGNNTVNLQNL